MSRWRQQPKRGYRFSNLTLLQVIHPWSWVTVGIHAFTSSYCEAALRLFVTSQRTRASRLILQTTIDVNVNTMKAHPCASMAYISSMKWIIHQLLIFRAWWRGRVLNVRLLFGLGKNKTWPSVFPLGRVKRNPANHKYTYSLKSQECVLFNVGV